MKLRVATPDAAERLAELHAAAFERGWSAADIAALTASPGGFVLTVGDLSPEGFILCRAVGGEAEILTLAVAPAARRRGLARGLVEAAEAMARAAGASAMFLEVADDNLPAVGLYAACGFVPVGRRRGYYERGSAPAADAIVMRRDLGPGD